MPVSSRVSRTAVWLSDSPGSWAPLGIDQLPLSVRWVSSTLPSRRTKADAPGLTLLAGGAAGSS